jgi:DNA repair protein RAD50
VRAQVFPLCTRLISRCRYEEADGDKLLEASEKAVRDLEQQIVKLDDNITELQEEIAELRNNLASSDQRAQNIDNNIAFRKTEKQILELVVEIESIDLEEAARAKQQFDTKYKKAERERTENYGRVSSRRKVMRYRLTKQPIP